MGSRLFVGFGFTPTLALTLILKFVVLKATTTLPNRLIYGLSILLCIPNMYVLLCIMTFSDVVKFTLHVTASNGIEPTSFHAAWA